jgi:hypothetical protein
MKWGVVGRETNNGVVQERNYINKMSGCWWGHQHRHIRYKQRSYGKYEL